MPGNPVVEFMHGNFLLAQLFNLLILLCIVAINTEAATMTINYSYDNLNRLTQAVYDNGKQMTYQYDSAGNILSFTPLDSSVDTDNDGMPDSWENTYSLNINVDDSYFDPDNDGFTNLDEYQGSTSPIDPQSYPSVTGYSVSTAATEGGTIYPSFRTIESSGQGDFTIIPDTDYDINYISGCNGQLTGNVYTTSAITENCTIFVDFLFKYIKNGFGHTCFKDENDQVKCWGR